MKIRTNFSFQGKSVAIIGGQGKMGAAFANGLQNAGADISIFDKNTGIPEKLSKKVFGMEREVDIILLAVSEIVTLDILEQLSPEEKEKPIITTSSTNSLLHGRTLREKDTPNIVPIDTLSGEKMQGAIMIDCTKSGTLSRCVAESIAKIFRMVREEIPWVEHDTEIALEQARFHVKVWDFIKDTPDLQKWAKLLPLSQRRAAIGELRVLMRPDISAELLGSFLNELNPVQETELTSLGKPKPNEKNTAEKVVKEILAQRIQAKDPDGLIRTWVISENERIDIGTPGGPRSFQEFVKSNT